jgi:hypothetical protein
MVMQCTLTKLPAQAPLLAPILLLRTRRDAHISCKDDANGPTAETFPQLYECHEQPIAMHRSTDLADS